ncbi:nuclear transport factor 2 family protein [Silvibacterium sp.]|uniref:nuclear transport factor 2 family protein n=1 Tax=Silvibacterium sp. TaxID=1964179 RepID=UPI0039E21FAE
MKRILIAATATLSLVSGMAFAQQANETAAPEAKQFQGLEDQWSAALMKRDQYTLENLMSPAFLDIAASGDITTRNQQIADLYTKTGPQPVSMEQKVVNVRMVEDVAIVDGTYIHKWKTGSTIHEERGIFTHVYQRSHGGWTCVHSQRTEVVEQSDAKQPKPKVEKKSNAEEPFHIPFFYKGKTSTQDTTSSGSTATAGTTTSGTAANSTETAPASTSTSTTSGSTSSTNNAAPQP